jgi:predicted DNA-binding helix-hairpin-helix protein
MRFLRALALLLLCAAGIFVSAQSVGDPLDINTATPQQLNSLPGFGPAYTRRVIAGRPYTAKNQLFTRGVVPKGAYERVSAFIIAHRVSAQSPRNPHPQK